MFDMYNDLLWARQSGDQILMGATFSAPVQTGPAAHPASYTIVLGHSRGAKQLAHGIDHPPPSSTKITVIVELYLYPPSEPS